MSANRFDFYLDGDDSEMRRSGNGDWVSYDDYSELESRIAELEKKIDNARAELS